MTPEQFAYWLQGYAEMGGGAPTPVQWKQIKDHLALVFDKQTPEVTLPSMEPAVYPGIPFGPPKEITPFTPRKREIIC